MDSEETEVVDEDAEIKATEAAIEEAQRIADAAQRVVEDLRMAATQRREERRLAREEEARRAEAERLARVKDATPQPAAIPATMRGAASPVGKERNFTPTGRVSDFRYRYSNGEQCSKGDLVEYEGELYRVVSGNGGPDKSNPQINIQRESDRVAVSPMIGNVVFVRRANAGTYPGK